MFTPIHSFLGGTLLFLSSRQYYVYLGRTLGCSTILSNSILHPKRAKDNLQLHALLGLLVGAFVYTRYFSDMIIMETPVQSSSGILPDWLTTILAGLLVGAGTKLANGCTSGHMLNGVARLSIRSIIATCCFFSSAVATVYFLKTGPRATAVQSTYVIDSRDSHNLYSLLLTWAFVFAELLCIPKLIKTGMRALPAARGLVAFNAGAVFAIGLCMSGMSQPAKTLGFLNFPRVDSFDPSLLMIVLGGLLPNAATFLLYDGRRKLPQLDNVMHVSTSTVVDYKLLGGSLLFGIGWGLSGICPGPAVVNLAAGQATKDIFVFVVSLLVGSALVDR